MTTSTSNQRAVYLKQDNKSNQVAVSRVENVSSVRGALPWRFELQNFLLLLDDEATWSRFGGVGGRGSLRPIASRRLSHVSHQRQRTRFTAPFNSLHHCLEVFRSPRSTHHYGSLCERCDDLMVVVGARLA